MIEVPGYLTDEEETITVSSTALGPTNDTFGGTCNPGGVFVMVLSNSIYLSLHGPTATPDADDFVAYTGDVFAVWPASKLRMIRNGSDSCVKLQGFVPS